MSGRDDGTDTGGGAHEGGGPGAWGYRVQTGAYRTWTTIQSQPSWVTRIAFLAAAFTITLVVLVLVIPAVLVGMVVFGVLAIWNAVTRPLRRLLGRDGQGRSNVRVIVRDSRL